MRTSKSKKVNDGKNISSKNIRDNQISPASKPQKVKEKTPSGHFRFNGKFYPVHNDNLPEAKLFCRSCKDNTARVIGKFFSEDGGLHYIIRCPFHPEERHSLEQSKFRIQHPNVLPESKSELTSEGYPVQKAYCKCHRATTATVIGESSAGYSWVLKCTICGTEWKHYKHDFAQKYIGVDGRPPIYPQTEPNLSREWHNADSIGKPIQGVTLDINFAPQKEPEISEGAKLWLEQHTKKETSSMEPMGSTLDCHIKVIQIDNFLLLLQEGLTFKPIGKNGGLVVMENHAPALE